MLNELKLMLGITDTSKDDLLNLLIDLSTNEIQNKTHNNDTESMKGIIEQVVIYKYNRLGTEGVSSESLSGVSYNYLTDYPQDILSEINSFRKVRVI